MGRDVFVRLFSNGPFACLTTIIFNPVTTVSMDFMCPKTSVSLMIFFGR